ncbi:MAG: endonuclease III, partial [Deltaproteobacteria bacterium]|nr:endonuclease III [Deltaproteobacteria bacterium]
MTTTAIEKALSILKREIKKWKVPVVGQFAKESVDRPFATLISCLLSLRTKDAVTEQATRRLFAVASTPQEIFGLETNQLEKLIYPVGFYRTKAKNLKETCNLLIKQHGARVPGTMEELLALPGVGRKTANLVLTVGHDQYGICVDTHVHRISNLWGYVKT